jgi:hypothetical protein
MTAWVAELLSHGARPDLLIELDVSRGAVDRIIGKDHLPYGAPLVPHKARRLPDWFHYQGAMYPAHALVIGVVKPTDERWRLFENQD